MLLFVQSVIQKKNNTSFSIAFGCMDKEICIMLQDK